MVFSRRLMAGKGIESVNTVHKPVAEPRVATVFTRLTGTGDQWHGILRTGTLGRLFDYSEPVNECQRHGARGGC
jgi:hypothetical protein